jgi:hypothetical protein
MSVCLSLSLSLSISLSLSLLIQASALALRDVPEVNSQWCGDFIRRFNDVDISVAVDTPGGLMTPIVKGADKKGSLYISLSFSLSLPFSLSLKSLSDQILPNLSHTPNSLSHPILSLSIYLSIYLSIS